MHMTFRVAFIALSALLSGCGESATPEDRAALLGFWDPEDGSKQIIEFKNNGEFDYYYAAILRMRWELTRVGRVDLSSVDGTVKWKCDYKIEGDRLTIGKSGGETCVSPGVAPPEPMPLTFRKMP